MGAANRFLWQMCLDPGQDVFNCDAILAPAYSKMNMAAVPPGGGVVLSKFSDYVSLAPVSTAYPQTRKNI